MMTRIVLLTTALLTLGASPENRSEPGAVDANDKAPPATLPATWSHPKIEARGVWIPRDSMEAKPGETVQQTRDRLAKSLDALKAANFNIVLIDGWFKGFTAYPGSQIAPQYPPFKDNDMFGFIIDGAHKRGLQAQAWLGYGFYAHYTPAGDKSNSHGAVLDAHPELTAVDSKGNAALHRDIGDFYSMCPSNPKSHAILGAILVEMATKYPIDGVHLDRIRYPESNYCYCDYCKEHFKADTGIELTEFSKGSEEAKKFLDWRREQTAKAVAHFEKVVHAARRGLVMTAYVLSPREMDSKAQGWDIWMKRGLLDTVAVSMYESNISASSQRALELLGENRSKLTCAVSCENPTNAYGANLEIARSIGAVGEFTWWLGKLDDDLPMLSKGPYSMPAESPFSKRR